MIATTAQSEILQGVSFSDYCALEAMNVSTLVKGFIKDGSADLFSCNHVRAAKLGLLRKTSTPQTQNGHAIHCRLLEPERYASDYLTATTCQAIVKSTGKVCGNTAGRLHEGQWYCGVKGHAPEGFTEPQEFVSIEQAAKIERIARELLLHDAVKLLRAQGGFEQTFTTELHGLPVKGRTDKDIARPKGNFRPCIVDLKTVSPCRFTDNTFFWQVVHLHYAEKMAWYCNLLQQIDGIEREALWVVIETEEPFTIRVVRCPTPLLRWGWNRISRAFGEYAECVHSGKWLVLFPKVQSLQIPSTFDMEF